MSETRTIEATIAEFEAWSAASERQLPFDPATGAEHLADLFARAQRGGADLHDPTGDLIAWLARDLARDDGDPAAYSERLAPLPWYLLFLEAHGLWRRSERAVQQSWEAVDIAAEPPLGLTTLGPSLDAALAEGWARRPTPAEVLATGVSRAFVTPLRATLDSFADRDALERSEVAAFLHVGEDSPALAVWLRSLSEAGLARVDDDGRLMPLRAVREAGGCPPPSAALIDRLVRGITRAALRTVAAGEPGAVEELVARVLGEPREDLAPDVLEMLQVLALLGVLDNGPGPIPAPFRHAVVRAVSEVTGVVGAPEPMAPWLPVELPLTMREDAALDVVASFEHDPGVWRRFRILGSLSLTNLHAMLQEGFGWRGTRPMLFCTADGTPLATVQDQLPTFGGEEHAAVVDAGGIKVGSLLKASGDELVYLYGSMTNPWRIRVRMERVMTGIKEPLSWLDVAGAVPAEPTRIGESLQRRLPEGMTLPAELEAAWAFMESKGWAVVTDDGARLTAPAPPEARPALVFSDALTLTDRYDEHSHVVARTLPIAGTPGDTRFALWLTDDGATRVVAFMPDGGASLIGSPLDLLRLAAVGYQRLAPEELGQPPQDPDAVASMAEFREWLRTLAGTDVPEMWGRLGDDEVTAWVIADGGDRSRSD